MDIFTKKYTKLFLYKPVNTCGYIKHSHKNSTCNNNCMKEAELLQIDRMK